MIDMTAGWVAQACGGRLVAGDPDTGGPRRAVIDSRSVGPGELFVGLAGEHADGGVFAAAALERGAWGVLVDGRHAAALGNYQRPVVSADDPGRALRALGRAWRRELGCTVVAITGSTGKTSTKDILAAMLTQQRMTHATHENWNTEIGLPLTILEAERGTQALVLELAMRGPGQIAELVTVCEPDVGVIVNVGPVHLELLGSVERVAAAKAELIRDLAPGAVCVVPAREPLLVPHMRDDVETVSFGEGGEVRLLSFEGGVMRVLAGAEELRLEVSFSEPHNLLNALAALAAARAIGVTPTEPVAVRFSSLRGEIVEIGQGVTVVNDCYNANPMSMRAALESLTAVPAGRHLAILGEMAEIGSEGARFHREVGRLAADLGVDVLVAVGRGADRFAEEFGGEVHRVSSPEEAGSLLDAIARPGDRVLIKGSRSVGLERVLGRREPPA
ncbi:MAG: UDP-N-acetylmuramoyl-tripeptide--D-alanyl-D-alanine ligase [Thermoleophilaceae bacterium]